jgi:NadR type nicotinamide-nucleotide adenylyltransferase
MLKKIVITGPESTGKSEMSQQLARFFETEWVPEFARFYLDRKFEPYQYEDLKIIAQGQLAWEDEKAEIANQLLVCDTDLLVIKIWSEHKYQKVDPWILDQLKARQYDHYLLMDIDLPWRDDPQREHPTLRKYFFKKYQQELEAYGFSYSVVSGIEEERMKHALSALKQNSIY